MSIRVALHHLTEYRYPRLVNLSPHVIRLRPAPHCRTPILSYSLKVSPGDHFLNWQQDPLSNYQARLVFNKPTDHFKVEVDLIAEMTAINPFDFFVAQEAEVYPYRYDPELATELLPYLETAPAGPRLQDLIDAVRTTGVRTLDFLVGINQHLAGLIKYVIRMEPGIHTPEETLTLSLGSCRDTGWLLVQLLRHLGLAARFASGYLIQLTPDVKPLDGPPGPENDFTDLHAWAEVYLPGAGWIGLDATSGLLAGEGHIPLACSADPIHSSPITGSYAWLCGAPPDGEEREQFGFQMKVTRIHEDPRVTRPYSDHQWQAIDSLGHRLDDALRAGDVRLSMGGEPTFVSIDDRDGDEWNIAAQGPTKRRLAGMLLRRLRDQFAPGGLLHFGQGKWYPGEVLPRWALGCHWRKDGDSIWQQPDLVADDTYRYGHGDHEARRFVHALAERLGVAAEFCVPGHEDVWYYLWRERKLPVNVDPLQNKLEDAEERRRLAAVFERGLGEVAGYALPLRPRVGDPWARPSAGRNTAWDSGPWFFRREHMYLLPGDSPMGLRLPLDALPWLAPGQIDTVYEEDPLAPRGPLPGRPDHSRQRMVQSGEREGPTPQLAEQTLPPVEGYTGLVRTALCVEPRDGRLHVFMPPVRFLEDYLDLVAAVEETAGELHVPVLVEGYPPPADYRLNHLSVTPDPGVIEVNIHPAHNWAELVKNTGVLYEAARQTRLSTEKFMLDGRHTGTGGGNHIVLGGPTPGDSPLLRRPDLLRSLIGCWHNHPSLSYLFSGLFVGPTSQAPRVDEARNDSLHELDIAFQQIPDPWKDEGGRMKDEKGNPADSSFILPPSSFAPWLVDRVFRHILTDVTGNTHRAEFCIDKLYSPDTSGGRRGLLELRSFEMPPHPQMSLVQQLLLRGLVARFWKTPYKNPLVRWGTALHDRFMLPHFVWQDLEDLLEEMRQASWDFQPEWFAPHFEFRFPQVGSVAQRGIHLELRTAIEPWHVLGEEPAGGAAARYVDSSVERLQVKVKGLNSSRHVILCNGRRVPLHPTGVVGEFVAGVRYRAWQPPSCLHPTIPVHAPLVLDILDGWLNRSLGGCTYHVAHPGGRSSETFPVNALEAEGRRGARFVPMGHSQGFLPLPAQQGDAEFPLTLDLRRV